VSRLTKSQSIFKKNNIGYNIIDVDLTEETTSKGKKINSEKRIIPTLILND
jgi:glutaredoxin